MLFAPGSPPLQQTRNSRELGKRVEQVVRDYRRDHPDTTEAEIRSALMQSVSPGDEEEGMVMRRRFAAIAAVLAVGIAVLITSLISPGRVTGSGLGWQIAGVGAAVAAVVFSIIRIARGGRIGRW
jgi:hypothetical protein